jgi:uncharacterized RDD family membrane protein YckC
VKTPVADAPPVWRRSIAALIDLTAVLGITALLWWLGIARLGTLFGEHFERLIAPIYALLIVAFMWQAVGRLMGAGSTLGERISGLRALDAQGERPHPIRILIRSAAGVLTAWPIGWWLCFADPAGQTLADRITGYRLTHAR